MSRVGRAGRVVRWCATVRGGGVDDGREIQSWLGQQADQLGVQGHDEASRPSELWVGDVVFGPYVPHPRMASSRRSFLFPLVDDFSRLIVHGAWLAEQNARAGQQVMCAAIQRRGQPEILYTDYADLRIMPTLAGARTQLGSGRRHNHRPSRARS